MIHDGRLCSLLTPGEKLSPDYTTTSPSGHGRDNRIPNSRRNVDRMPMAGVSAGYGAVVRSLTGEKSWAAGENEPSQTA